MSGRKSHGVHPLVHPPTTGPARLGSHHSNFVRGAIQWGGGELDPRLEHRLLLVLRRWLAMTPNPFPDCSCGDSYTYTYTYYYLLLLLLLLLLL